MTKFCYILSTKRCLIVGRFGILNSSVMSPDKLILLAAVMMPILPMPLQTNSALCIALKKIVHLTVVAMFIRLRLAMRGRK
jgi:hypothetical protein